MNILRWKRKSKKKLKLRTLILVIFSLMMTTFAWFAYSKVLDTSLNLHMASWDMKYYMGTGENRQEKTNPISIEIPTLYPTMPDLTETIYIENNGERLVDIDYHVESLTIAGIPFELVQEGDPNTTNNYIILTPSVLETIDTNTGEKVVKGAITNDITKIPFTIEIEHSPQINPVTTDENGVKKGGEGYLKITVKWIGDNDNLDSEWGHMVGEYLINNPDVTSIMSIVLSIDSYQAGEEEYYRDTTMPYTTQTKPYLPTGFNRMPGTTLESGLVVKDSVGNEYVWIEVPKSEQVYPNAGLEITEFTTDQYTTIENDLKTYVGTYRNETTYSDIPFSYQANGLSDANYNTLKQKMLKSIYQNGGFYVGRYETGILGSPRTVAGETTQTAVIKTNAYTYGYVTCSQAQELASGMESGEYTTSLMFGIQWDLILKYLETKGITQSELTTDSTLLGNYKNNLYTITNRNALYSINSGQTYLETPYEKETTSAITLTTGSNSMFSRQNIYDLGGNVSEWTLEYSSDSSTPSVHRGGTCEVDGDIISINNRNALASGSKMQTIGFRVVLY